MGLTGKGEKMYEVAPLVPAYGRDYNSVEEAQADFDADKDFCTAFGQYINRPQVKELGLTTIQVRWHKGVMGYEETGMLTVS
jgi:hypothetical protein